MTEFTRQGVVPAHLAASIVAHRVASTALATDVRP